MNKGTNSVFYIITAASILVLYFLLQPKISSILFGTKKSALIDTFIKKTVQEKRVNVQEFWKMREFYCPGSFVFDKTKNPFLIYSCKWLKSKDYLTTSPNLSLRGAERRSNLVFENTTTQIYKQNGNIIIHFIASSEEMKKAVGYFDYNEKDKELVKDKYWMDITTISRK